MVKPKIIKLYVIEEQEIYREIYKSILTSQANIELLRLCGIEDREHLLQSVADLSPDVLLLSVKQLDVAIIEELEQIRNDHQKLGIVILLVFYSSQDIEWLRQLAMSGGGGMALFLKQSLDEIDQLCRTIVAVSQGQVMLDPRLANLMFAGRPKSTFMKQLTTRELEVLSLLSLGYTNSAISKTLGVDIKTVEHHLNSMYSKLKADPDYHDKQLRMSAARIYLETMGDLKIPGELKSSENDITASAC